MWRYDALRIITFVVMIAIAFAFAAAGYAGMIGPDATITILLMVVAIALSVGYVVGTERPTETHEFCNRPINIPDPQGTHRRVSA